MIRPAITHLKVQKGFLCSINAILGRMAVTDDQDILGGASLLKISLAKRGSH